MTARRTALWTFVVTALALFMTALDNLVVTTALPVIKADLGASLAQLEWTVNAYTLAFAVLLLTGAALGDRFGRKRVFLVGLTIFTGGSAAAALAPTGDLLVIARAIQGIGAAIVTPLTLTLLSAAVPPERRGLALGAWGGISGLAIAIGPVVGGAIIQGLNWHWIFWLNVPLGVVVLVLAALRLTESRGPVTRLDLPGLVLASSGLFALVWALIHGNGEGWTSAGILAAFAAAAVLLAGFVIRESRTSEPMLPLRFFESRQFATVNVVSFVMSFGIFGSIFLLAQFFQIVQGYTPLEAGIRTLPWTGMPIIVAPLAGLALSRVGGRTLLAAGMALMGLGLAWIAAVATPTVEYARLVPAFVLAGTGHVALLRADREPGARRGAAGRGGPGVGRQQRDPRDRRGLRRGHPRLGLLRGRWLRIAAGIRERARPGRLARRGGPRDRHARGARDPGKPARGDRGPRGHVGSRRSRVPRRERPHPGARPHPLLTSAMGRIEPRVDPAEAYPRRAGVGAGRLPLSAEPRRWQEVEVGMRVPDLGSLVADVQARRMALDATGSYFVTDIDAAHAEDFAKSILLMSIPRRGQRDQPITVYINSGGGSVGDGLAMMEMINRMRRRFDVRIDTVVLGYAYSMGAIVSQAGDHRSIGRFGTLMLHSTQWILSGEDERIFKDYQQLSEHYQHTVAELFARRTAYRDEAWWRRFIWSGRERFLGPDECLQLGLVDEILEPANLPVETSKPRSPKQEPPTSE